MNLEGTNWTNLPKGDAVKAGLEGPSKTIIVEPKEEPLYVPEEAPAAPVEEPVKV